MLRFDLIAAGLSVVLHAGVAVALTNVDVPLGPKRPSIVHMVVKSNPPPQPPASSPEPKRAKIDPPREQPKKKPIIKTAEKLPPPPATHPREQPPQEQPKIEHKPVFGLKLGATTNGESSLAMPVGDTVRIDPRDSGKGPPGQPISSPAAGGEPSEEERARSIQTLPQIDTRACGKMIVYPEEAEQLGIEGDVTLRVSLDARGHVRDAKVLRGLGHGLDQTARHALMNLCSFTPAIASDGKPVAYVIPEYVFHFAIPR